MRVYGFKVEEDQSNIWMDCIRNDMCIKGTNNKMTGQSGRSKYIVPNLPRQDQGQKEDFSIILYINRILYILGEKFL